MMNIGKEQSMEKIRKFSRVICVFLQIALVASIVSAVLVGVALIGTSLPGEEIEVDGRTVVAPVLFKLGDTTVTLPFIDMDGGSLQTVASGWRLADIDGLGAGLCYTIAAIVTVVLAKRVFIRLRESGTPFRADVARPLRRLAVALLALGVFGGAAGFLAAAVVWVLYLVFSYGRTLQDESDTTL